MDRQAFARQVVGAVGTVRYFYAELARVFDSLLDVLSEAPVPMVPLTVARPPADNGGRLQLRDAYGGVFRAELGNGDRTAPHEPHSGGRTRRVALRGDDVVLAVHVAIRDSAGDPNFEPQVRYAVLSGWAIGPDGRKPAHDEVMEISADRALALPESLMRVEPGQSGPSASHDLGISVMGSGRATARRLACSLAQPARWRPLYSLHEIDGVNALALDMKRLVRIAMLSR